MCLSERLSEREKECVRVCECVWERCVRVSENESVFVFALFYNLHTYKFSRDSLIDIHLVWFKCLNVCVCVCVKV